MRAAKAAVEPMKRPMSPLPPSPQRFFQGNDITFTVPEALPESLHGECEVRFCSVDLIFEAPVVAVHVR